MASHTAYLYGGAFLFPPHRGSYLPDWSSPISLTVARGGCHPLRVGILIMANYYIDSVQVRYQIQIQMEQHFHTLFNIFDCDSISNDARHDTLP